MATISTLAVNLIARTSVFDRKMRKSTGTLKGFASDIARTSRFMLSFAKGALVAAGVGGIGFMVKKTMEQIDATAKLSDRLQIATEDLVALQHAAKISGMDTEGMNKALETYVRRLGEVKMGVGQAKYALDGLGLSADELSKRDHIDNLKLIADRINALPTAADRASAAYYLFGRQGVKMLNLLQKGSAGIEEFREEAEKLGLTFNRLDAAKVEAANDAITRSKAKFQGYVQLLTIELAPSIEAIADKLTNLGNSSEQMRTKMVSALKAVAMGLALVGNMVTVVKVAIKGIAGILLGVATAVASIFSKLLGLIEAAQHKLAELYNKMADTNIGEKIGLDTMGKLDLTSTIDGYTEGLANQTFEMFGSIKDDLENLPTSKVGEWFADLEQRSKELETSLNNAAKAKAEFADPADLIDQKSVLESTRNAIESIRSQNYLTRMERIQALKEYARVNKDTLSQVADAHKLLNEEILTLERSRLDQIKVYMAELREDMQNWSIYVSERMANAARSIEGAFSDTFHDIFMGAENLKDVFENLATSIQSSIARAFSDMLARQLMASIMMPMAGSMFMAPAAAATPSLSSAAAMGSQWMEAPVMHGGGIAGISNNIRRIPAATFNNAPRYHDGLMPNEVPAILENDEGVFTPEQMKAMGGGGKPVQVTFNMGFIDPSGADQFFQKYSNRIASEVLKQQQGNHPLRRFQR